MSEYTNTCESAVKIDSEEDKDLGELELVKGPSYSAAAIHWRCQTSPIFKDNLKLCVFFFSMTYLNVLDIDKYFFFKKVYLLERQS